MNIYDPHAHQIRAFEACKTLAPVEDTYIPVRSLTGKWFVVHARTLRSAPLEQIEDRRLASVVESRIATQKLVVELLDACEMVRQGFLGDEIAEGDLEQVQERLSAVHGRPPSHAAVATALHEGYDPREVNLGVSHLLREATLDGVETVRISELAENAE